MGINMVVNITTMSLRQSLVPPHLLGRVRTVSNVLSSSATPLGAFVGGWVIVQTGNIVAVYLGIGALICGIAGAAWFSAFGRFLVTEGHQ